MSDFNSYKMPPKQRTIIEPMGGWENGYYVVDVAFNAQNPIHRAILWVALRNNAENYGRIVSTSVEECATPVRALHYLKPISKVKDI